MFAPMRVTRILVILVTYITVLGFYSLYRNLTDELEAQTFQATEEQMVESSHLFASQLEMQLLDGDQLNIEPLAQIFEKAKQHKFEAKIFNLNKTHIGSNFYVTDAKGIVLYDSEHPARVGADYSQNNDVYLALSDKYAVRSSRDDENNSSSSVLYVATAIKNAEGKVLGVLSLYKPQNDVRPFIDHRHRSILISLAMIGSGIVIFIIAVFIWLFYPLGKLTEFANAISRGERPDYPKLGKGREVNTLGTALREMRAALEGRRYVEQYTQILTHELKSPLAAISGAAELLNEDMPVEHRRKFLANIRRESSRSTQIIDGLLKLSQLESQSQLLKKTPVVLETVIQSASDSLKPRLQTKGIHLEILSNPKHTLVGDAMLLETALTNLLENAIHFSPQNSTIRIVSTQTDADLTLSVTDQGPGIPEYAKERVFERFYSHHPDNDDHPKGSGLGLVFVQEVAKLHNGTATLQNSESAGAVATITFPKASS